MNNGDGEKQKGFFKFPNDLFEALCVVTKTLNEHRALGVIIRFSIGCNNQSAKLQFADFQMAGMQWPHIRKTLEQLSDRYIITWDQQQGLFSLNASLADSFGFEPERRSKVLYKNLTKRKVKAIHSMQSILYGEKSHTRNSKDRENNREEYKRDNDQPSHNSLQSFGDILRKRYRQ